MAMCWALPARRLAVAASPLAWPLACLSDPFLAQKAILPDMAPTISPPPIPTQPNQKVVDAFLLSQGSSKGGSYFLGGSYRCAARLALRCPSLLGPAWQEESGTVHSGSPAALRTTTPSCAPPPPSCCAHRAGALPVSLLPPRCALNLPPTPPFRSIAEVLTTSLLHRAITYTKAYRGVDLWQLVQARLQVTSLLFHLRGRACFVRAWHARCASSRPLPEAAPA